MLENVDITLQHGGRNARVESSTWEDVFETMESFLIDLEIQSTDPNLTYHEAALLMNRLETAVSILRSLTDLFSMGSSAASNTDTGRVHIY